MLNFPPGHAQLRSEFQLKVSAPANIRIVIRNALNKSLGTGIVALITFLAVRSQSAAGSTNIANYISTFIAVAFQKRRARSPTRKPTVVRI